LPDGARIAARIAALWEIAHGPGGGADRPAFSPTEAKAMRIVAGWAESAGLEPGLDRHGNLWALPPGWDGPLVTSGSHVDTVPDGGRYDGALGTVLGLELADELRAGTPGGTRPALLICAAEEAPRFGAGTIGSRCLAGTLTEGALDELHDAAGISAAEARADYRALVDLPELEAPEASTEAAPESSDELVSLDEPDGLPGGDAPADFEITGGFSQVATPAEPAKPGLEIGSLDGSPDERVPLDTTGQDLFDRNYKDLSPPGEDIAIDLEVDPEKTGK